MRRLLATIAISALVGAGVPAGALVGATVSGDAKTRPAGTPVATKAQEQRPNKRLQLFYLVVRFKLVQNLPYVRGKSDCSLHAWEIAKTVFPEWEQYDWFVRTTATVMSRWPWWEVKDRSEIKFGDFVFGTEDPLPAGLAAKHAQIAHIQMGWREGHVVHAIKSRGFTESPLGPYWRSRIASVKRPPYWRR